MLPGSFTFLPGWRGEADLSLFPPFLHDFLQPREGATDDEKNAPRVDRLAPRLAAALHIHHGLHLPG
ncbi:MAG: hypothetical protein ACK559_20565, partial [bacterium]